MAALDERYREYATPRQWQVLETLAEHGPVKAAAVLGVNRSYVTRVRQAVRAKAAQHGFAPDHDMLYPAAPGFKVKGTSTLYDNSTGEPRLQWVKTTADAEQQEQMFRDMVEALASELPRLPSVDPPGTASADLCACYPVGDHHMGLLAWHEENGGENYNIKEAERLLMGAVDHLVQTTPNCDQALLAILGDFFHYDSPKPITPTSGHQLDADSRPSEMIRAGLRVLKYLIEALRRHHGKVHIIIEIGNHDPYTALFLMEAFASMYEADERVTVDTSPRHYHYFRFGKCLIGTHHGHGAKLQDLPLIMATDRPEDWGATTYRYFWTDHDHHDRMKDIRQVKVEGFRILAPSDAWADKSGYRSMRDMRAIVLHRDHGEVARHTVNPEMLL